MNIRYIYGNAGSGKTSLCIDEIYEKSNQTNNSIIYIVPEQFTLQSEKNLLKKFKSKVLLNIHILSFKRLAHNLFSETGVSSTKILGETGKLMLIRKIVYENTKKFVYFKKSLDKDGFIENISSSITEFFKYNVSASDLEKKLDSLKDSPDLYEKTKDLILIYKEYVSYLEKEYISSDETLDLLSEKIKESEFIKNSEIWIDEFSGFTPQEFKVLKELFKYAHQINITFCLNTKRLVNKSLNQFDPFFETKNTLNKLNTYAKEANAVFLENTYLEKNLRQSENKELLHLNKNYLVLNKKEYSKEPKNIVLTKTKNKYNEIDVLAKNILNLVRDENYRYKDIAVILGDSEYETLLKTAFSKFKIPYFIDTKKDVSSNRIYELITSFLEIFTSFWSYEPIFRFLKTYLTSMSYLDINLLENYVIECGIKGKKWFIPVWKFGFTNPEFNEDDINYLKDYFFDILKPFTEHINTSKNYTIKEFSFYLYKFLDSLELDKKLDFDNNPEHLQIYNAIIDLLDKTVEILGEQTVSLKEYAKILNSGLKSCKIGRLPETQDEVIVGDLKRTRLSDIKALFILSVNDGIIPASPTDNQIFSDEDKSLLNSKGIELSPNSFMQMNFENFLLFSMFAKPTDKLYLSYISETLDGKQKRYSKVIYTIKKIFPKIQEVSSANVLDDITLAEPSFSELSTFLYRYSKESNTDDLYIDLYNFFRCENYFKEKLDSLEKYVFLQKKEDYIPKQTVRMLYGKELSSSVTRLEKFSECPLSYFIKYGLRASERKRYEISALDTGSIFHSILENFSKYMVENKLSWDSISENKINEIIETSIDFILSDSKNKIFEDSAKNKFLLSNIKTTSRKTIQKLSEHIEAGKFTPIGFEVDFGLKSKLPPVIIELNDDSKLILTGKIDRIDIMTQDGKNYVKIIDYKTGKTDFDLLKVYYGLQLQLIIYIDSLLKKGQLIVGKDALPAGVFYFKIQDDTADFKTSFAPEPEEIKEKIKELFKMSGLAIKDLNVLQAIDKFNTGKSNIFAYSFNKDGVLKDSDGLISQEDFGELRNYVISLAQHFGNEILDGNIKLSPYTIGTNKSACQYCQYSAICQISLSETKPYRQLEKKPVPEILANIKEANK